MLPNTIVGSVITGRGTLPFVIDTATGSVSTGRYGTPDPGQRNMGSMEHAAVDKQVRAQLSGVVKVRIGSFQCPDCARWVDVVARPNDWAGERCSRC